MGRALGPLLITLLLLVVPAASMAAGTERIIVKRASGASGAEIRAGAGVRLVRRLGLPRTQLVRAADPERALDALNADPDVVYAVPNLRGHAADDPRFAEQWDVTAIDAPLVWPSTQGAGETVAVVDGWIDSDHADLHDNVVPGDDYVRPPEPPQPDDEHGTHVAGVLAAVRDNGIGVAGVAPGASLMPLRVLDESGSGSLAHVLQAFDDAPGARARVVSASLTFGPIASDSEARGLAAAFNDVAAAHRDTLYVVAAGNAVANREAFDNDVLPSFPCNATAANVICVGASTESDAPAALSNYGAASVDLFAPGIHILSTFPRNRYGTMSGTSMATPHVSAVAALVRSLEPLPGAQLRNLIMYSVDKVPALSGKAVTDGRVNAQNAVLALDDAADNDGDGVVNAIDNCRNAANAGQGDLDYDGPGDACDGDRDGDAVRNTADRCPDLFGTAADGCALPPPPPDRDRDGVADAADRCPDVPGTLAGCPLPPPDADGDGRIDAQDACPGEPAQTSTGCPVPALVTLTSAVNGRRAKVRAVADRAADVLFKIERRRCTAAGCRWKRVVRESAQAPTGGVTLKLSGLRRGRYRATVRLSSPAGDSPLAYERFRIRP